MSKIYTVIEVNWEYDDQYYFRSGSQYGTNGVGIKAFKNKEAAEQYARNLNIKQAEKIFDCLNIMWYEVQEFDIED